MKTTTSCSLLATALLCLTTALTLHAQGPGRGQGIGGGGGHGPGGGQGGFQGGFQEAIHELFANHEKIKRTVEMTDAGYKSRTVSDDPGVAKTLQKHVKEMRERLGAGMMIRRWDPAFAELVEHYKDIDHEFKEVEGGVEMIAKGKTPEAIKVAQNHARIVSGFVKKGPDQMHESHDRALGDGKKAAEKDAGPVCPDDHGKPEPKSACQKCQEKPGEKQGCPKCQEKPGAKTSAGKPEEGQPK